MDLWTYGTRKVCLRVISRSVIQTGWEEIWPYGPEREKFNCKKTGEMNQKEQGIEKQLQSKRGVGVGVEDIMELGNVGPLV